MATKKDLIEAQGFSRRRLLSAFTSGAPGGKELEPAAPLRAVLAGVVLSAMVILAGVFYGLLRPGLPAGWEDNTLVLVKDSGARYLSIDSVLYPVINTASARLLMPSGDFKVVTTDKATLDGIEIGSTIGILGAPDDIPGPDALINDDWTACVAPDATTSLALPKNRIATPVDEASVVELNDRLYVVAGDTRYEVAAEDADAVLRAVGLNAASAIEVDDRWLNLFDEGESFTPLVTSNAGDALSGTDLTIGTVVHQTGDPDDTRYLITADGKLAPLSPLAYQLYLLGSGALLGGEQDESPAELRKLTTTEAAGGIDWPEQPLAALPLDSTACAVLGHNDAGEPTTRFATLVDDEREVAEGVDVSVGGGALVRVGGSSADGAGLVYLVDESGTAYPVPGADADLVGRLGYDTRDVSLVPSAWLQFMPAGPELTVDAAGSSPEPAVAVGK